MPKRSRNGFTLVELLVVIGIIAVLIGILLPVINKARESGKRVTCASNLRQIGQSILLYKLENGEYPRGVFSWNNTAGPKAFSGYNGDNPFASSSATTPAGTNGTRPTSMDVTVPLFLLIRTQNLSSKLFICPSTEGTPDDFQGESPLLRSNFTSRQNLTYSIAMEYPTQDTTISGQWGYEYGADMKADLPLMSDMNPGDGGMPKLSTLTLNSSPRDMEQGNSLNHNRAGQNVLYVDGRVEWQPTPFCGSGKDNIFTKQKNMKPAAQPPLDQASDTAEPWGPLPPRDVTDSQLLPTATADPAGIDAY